MKYFEEKQKFDQWWLYAIIFLALTGILYGLYQKTEGFSDFTEPLKVLMGIFSMFLVGMILILRLHTRISSRGIKVWFSPVTFFTRNFEWNEIDEIYLRKYSAIQEYGGWGIRGLFPAKAYNTSGIYGIQIVTKNGQRFLIGTQKPKQVEKFLNARKKSTKNMQTNQL